MSTATPTILMTLATGKQGLATVSALLASGAKVHAVVRDPTSPTAVSLSQQQGVTLFKGTNDDTSVFRTAAEGCTALFLNIPSWPTNPDPARQARGILEACKEAGITHVVTSTSGWAGDTTKWDIPLNRESWLAEYNRNEAAVEDVVRASGLKSWTIIRPFWFYSNYLPPIGEAFYPALFKKEGNNDSAELLHSFAPGRVFPHIDVADIGRFAALALCDPDTFNRQEIELAGQNLTVEEVADAIRKVPGRQIKLRRRTPVETQRDEEVVPWQLWANAVDLTVDIGALRSKYGFKFTTFEEFLEREKDRFI